jgi:hypothetical protein
MKPGNLQSPFLKALLYGQPGSTKTRTSATACFDEEFAPVLMLESAGNPLSLRDYDPAPTIFSMERLKDYNSVYDFLLTGQQKNHPFRKMCSDADVPLEDYYRTVILDGTTQIQRFAFDVVVPGTDVPPGDIPAAYEYQHFNRVLGTMINFTEKFIRTLDMHVILTALEDEHQEKSGETKIRPLLWGQSRGEICGYAYLVMRLCPTSTIDSKSKSALATDLEMAKKAHTVGFVKATNTFYAKDQYGMRDEDGNIMSYMFDPSISKIWDSVVAVKA